MSIRPDALPATTDDLLRMRGRGWLSNFPVGNTAPAPGLPIVNTSRWDTGVQAHGVTGMIEWTGSVTAGSLSDPRFRDNNAGRQLCGPRRRAADASAHGVWRVGIARRVAGPQRSTTHVAGATRATDRSRPRLAATPSIPPGPFLSAARRSARRGRCRRFGTLNSTEPLRRDLDR